MISVDEVDLNFVAKEHSTMMIMIECDFFCGASRQTGEKWENSQWERTASTMAVWG